MDGDRDGLFLFFVVSAPSLQEPHDLHPGRRWLPATFQPLLTAPGSKPTQQDPDNGVDAQRFVLLLTVRRLRPCGCAMAVLMARLRAVEIHQPLRQRCAVAAQGLRQPVHQGRLSPASEDHEEAAGAVSAATNSPDPIGRSPHRSVHRSPKPQANGLAISIASAKSGYLGGEALWGDDIDMVGRVRLSLFERTAKPNAGRGPA